MMISVILPVLLISAQLAGAVQPRSTPVLSAYDNMLRMESEAYRAKRLRAAERRKIPLKYELGQADIVHYNIECRINPSSKYLETKAKVFFKSLIEGLSDITLVMYDDSLNIAYVVQGTDTLTYGYDPYWGLIFINLKTPLSMAQLDSIEISYSGYITTELSALYNSSGQLDSIYSYATYCPDLWYPYSYENYFGDRVDDKATAEIKLTVPSGYMALSNGVLTDSILSDSSNIYLWSIRQPVWEFNFAISPYWAAAVPYDTIALSCYDPDSADSRDEMLGILSNVVSFYSQRFGKYSMGKLALADNGADFGYGGNSMIVMPLPSDYSFMAHETAHEWWAQMVSLRYWDEVWLNEGFASYSTVLFAEDSLGESEKDAILYNWDSYYKNRVASFTDQPIVPAPWSSPIYYSIVYLKGAWVLHMLRGVMGDSSFNDLMKNYFSVYSCSDSSAVISMFRQTAEQVYGSDLGWFFNQWLYHPGYPFYGTVYYFNTHNGDLSAHVKISQRSSSQDDPVIFKMPLEINIKNDTLWSNKIVLWDSLAAQDFWINDTLPMSELALDRDNKVLKGTYNSLPILRYLNASMDSGSPQITAIWNRFEYDSSCGSYNLYRSLSSDGPFARVNSEIIPDTSFTDTTISADTEYYYYLTAVDSADTCYETHYLNVLSCLVSGVEGNSAACEHPAAFMLDEITPNPFNQSATVSYQTLQSGPVNLKIYNISGQLVKTLVNSVQPSGRHQTQWNGRDGSGNKISSGLYFIKLEAGGRTITRTLQYIK